MPKLWKKGRGKLGPLQPLLGDWVAEADSDMGPVRCTRSFTSILDRKFIELQAQWEIGRVGEGRRYEERALLGVGDDRQVRFWSYTSDGKRSEGWLADVSDLHPEAVGFEADMPAGRARMAYWPEADGGFTWVVESRTVKGWRRFVEHRYRSQTRS